MRYSLQIHPFEASAAQTARRKVVMAAPGVPAKVEDNGALSNPLVTGKDQLSDVGEPCQTPSPVKDEVSRECNVSYGRKLRP